MTRVRAAFHVHSEWSYDAEIPLAELAALFRSKRYDAVFMCEHDRGFSPARFDSYRRACADASSAGALLVPGIEYADPKDRVHVPVWGEQAFLGEGLPTTRLLEAVRDCGGAAVLAHPVRRDAWAIVDPAWFELLTGLETWTRKWDGWAPNRAAANVAAANGLVAVAALDLHQRHQLFPLAMELEAEAPVNVESCVAAFRNRRCRPLIGRLPAAAFASGSLGACAARVEGIRRPTFRHARQALERAGLRR
jgi:hypothetical protein